MPNKYVKLQTIAAEELLYHYTKSNGIQGIMRDQAFYATKSNFLNDSNEMKYTISLLEEILEETEQESWKQLLKDAFSEMKHMIERQSFYVTSFSTDPDSITLWSEFGDKTGYNLEFNSGELLDKISQHRRIAYHGYVIYSKKVQKKMILDILTKEIPENLQMSFKEIMDKAANGQDNEPFSHLCRSFKKVIGIYSLFFKQEEFAAEREYRMAFREKSPEEIRFREKDGFLMPYITVKLDSGKECIRRITVAPKNHVDLAEAGMKMFSELLGYEVEVSLSNIHLRY